MLVESVSDQQKETHCEIKREQDKARVATNEQVWNKLGGNFCDTPPDGWQTISYDACRDHLYAHFPTSHT